jgi:hypothetical protein
MASSRFSGGALVAAGSSVLMVCLAAGAARAETYKLTDEKGRVQYTDRLPPDQINRGNIELSKQGMTKKVTAPALTPEQRAAEEAKEERKKQEERALARQRSEENALLSSYTSESDIDIAKRRNLALVGAGILSAEARIKALQKRSDVLEKEKLFYEKKPVPDKLKRELAAVTAEIPKQYDLIAAKNAEALAVEMKYTQQKERYRQLKAQIARDTSTPRLQ